jgi:restriction system protein
LIAKRNEERRRQEEEFRLRELAMQQRMQTLDGLRQMDPTEFEKAVGSLYLAQGWGVFVTPRSGDRGIDLVLIKESRKIAVQCKKYKATVSERLVREFYGSFVGHFAGGVFVTTSSYSPACVEWAKKRKSRLTLVNGETLASLMAEHKPPRVDKFELWQGRA